MIDGKSEFYDLSLRENGSVPILKMIWKRKPYYLLRTLTTENANHTETNRKEESWGVYETDDWYICIIYIERYGLYTLYVYATV